MTISFVSYEIDAMPYFKKLLLLVFIANSLFAFPQSSNRLSVGINVLLPASIPFYSNNDLGYGVFIKGEHFTSQKFSLTASLGYNYFKAKITNMWDGTVYNDFASMPLLFGARYYVNNFHLAAEFGMAIGSKNAGTKFFVSPSLGYTHKKWDASVFFMGVPQGYSFAENIYTKKGGYSYLGIRTAYIFKN